MDRFEEKAKQVEEAKPVVLEVLKEGPMLAYELIDRARRKGPHDHIIRHAFWQLIREQQIELTEDRLLQLVGTKTRG